MAAQSDSLLLRNMGYLLGGRINSGTFSVIHCGLQVSAADVVAVKIMDLKNVSMNFRTRFLPRELANIQRLNHPNIIKVLKTSRSEEKVYIVMDCAKSNLREEIDRRTYIVEHQARRWFCQLASAIEYLQLNGVAHRDIKIENVLIDQRGTIKLCDFGFSKYVDRRTDGTADANSTTFCGSLAYCAPEILLRKPYDPWKTDAWALGVVLYKMVVGVMPFGEGNDLSSVRKIAKAQTRQLEFPPFPRTSSECQALIRALLTFECEQRITLMDVAKSKWLNPHLMGGEKQQQSRSSIPQQIRSAHATRPLSAVNAIDHDVAERARAMSVPHSPSSTSVIAKLRNHLPLLTHKNRTSKKVKHQ